MNWEERDKKHLWHALTQHKTSPDPRVIVKSQGVWLFDDQGNKYFDGISSWYTCMYGHCHPQIQEAVTQQIQTMDHVVFSGFTHPQAIGLSEKLIEILPNNQNRLFFSDNGSTSVEVALKMALQYHFNKGLKKTKIIAFEDGFHGDTFGAMSASGLSVYNGPFEDFFIDVVRIPLPTAETISQVLNQLQNHIMNDDVAAFIYEPLIQGANCMSMYDAEPLESLLSLCKENHVLCIADEVMTGFGKTGSLFASDKVSTKPDIMCFSKALTAGALPMAITSCSEEVYQAFLSEDVNKAFLHAHTYTATPLACAVASTAIDLLLSEGIQNNIQIISEKNKGFAVEIKHHRLVKNARSHGVILAFELAIEADRYGNIRNSIYEWFMQKGVYLRPLGTTIYWVPPFITSSQEVELLFQTTRQFLDEFDL